MVVCGVRRLVMDGEQPARVPDAVIAEIRANFARDESEGFPSACQ